jgi:hypothetical protein
MFKQFLLSSRAKTLTLASVARMSDEEAEAVFRKIRWASNPAITAIHSVRNAAAQSFMTADARMEQPAGGARRAGTASRSSYRQILVTA